MKRYESPRVFLSLLYEEKRAKNPKYSLRAWARRIGVSVSTLSRVVSGERPLSYELAVKVVEHLEVSESDQTILILMALRENAKTAFELALFSSLVEKLLEQRQIASTG